MIQPLRPAGLLLLFNIPQLPLPGTHKWFRCPPCCNEGSDGVHAQVGVIDFLCPLTHGVRLTCTQFLDARTTHKRHPRCMASSTLIAEAEAQTKSTAGLIFNSNCSLLQAARADDCASFSA